MTSSKNICKINERMNQFVSCMDAYSLVTGSCKIAYSFDFENKCLVVFGCG